MSMRSLAAPLALGLVLAGCSFDVVRRRAAHDLACAESKIETTQLDESRLRATGCGRSATYFCGVDARGFDSCTREKPNPRKEVQATASVDLACPPEKIASRTKAGRRDVFIYTAYYGLAGSCLRPRIHTMTK